MKYLLLTFLFIQGFIYSQTPVIKAGNSSSFINDTVFVQIAASNVSDIGAITLKIQFSTASLTFLDVVNWDTRLSEALSGVDGNVITLAWDGLNAVSYTNGKIAELKFIYKGGQGDVKFNSASCEIASSSGQAIACTYTDGRVTQIPAPSVPVLISPANLSQVQQTEQILTWNSVENARVYKLQVSGDSLFNNLFLSDSGITAPSKKVQGLSNNTAYFWRVSAANPSGQSSYSERWSFRTVISLPSKPVPVSPADQSRHLSANLKLTWNPSQNAESYLVNLYEYIPKDGATVINLRASFSNITATSVDITGLLEGTKYVWSLRARNIAGTSDSSVSSFTTKLLAPEQLKAEVYNNTAVKLSWLDKSQNEQGYIIERGKGSNPLSLLTSVPANQVSFTDSLLPSAKYIYRIKAFNAVDSSDYSNEAGAEILTGVDKDRNVPDEFALLQNYPNPFNPSTVIRYSLPDAARVKLSIYNSLGQMVNELINEVEPAGNYGKTFNAAGLPSGIYYYSIAVQPLAGKNNFNSARKMILCK